MKHHKLARIRRDLRAAMRTKSAPRRAKMLARAHRAARQIGEGDKTGWMPGGSDFFFILVKLKPQVPSGWWCLLELMLYGMRLNGGFYGRLTVKEKYGQLRVWHSSYAGGLERRLTPGAEAAIIHAEVESLKTCQECGDWHGKMMLYGSDSQRPKVSVSQVRVRGWIRTLCGSCELRMKAE